MMRKILCATSTFVFMKAIFIFPVLAGEEYDEFLGHLKASKAARLAKGLSLSAETLSATSAPNSNKKVSKEEINELTSRLLKALPQRAASSENEEILEGSFKDLMQLRSSISTSSKDSNETIKSLKQIIKPLEDLTTKALRIHVTNAFNGHAFIQFKKDMRGVLTTMATSNTMNLNTLLSNEVFINTMKQISSKIISNSADKDSKNFVAWWHHHIKANFPVYAAQLIKQLSDPNMKNLTGAALENALANPGAEELYLQEREKQSQNTPHREHIQPYVDTAITPDITAEAMVTMMAKKIVDEELATEKEKMKTTTNQSLKEIQRDTIGQLESLSKELEGEEKLVLEFWGILQSLKGRVLASMIQAPTR